MSSPTPPPGLPPLQIPHAIPLKRSALSSASSSVSQALATGPNPKRARMHPLRQTSFPTTSSADSGAIFDASASRTFSDAGSVTGSFTGSLGGKSSDGSRAFARQKKRGRRSKADIEREAQMQREDTVGSFGGRGGGSLYASRVGSVEGDAYGEADADGSVARGGGGGARGTGAGADDAEDEEDFDEGELLGAEGGVTDTEAEKKNLALLVDAFNPQQSERYDLFKRAKLRKETLRRIVNHALSQSVPASVVTTINGFTKVFAGEIIEKARTVQAEWAEAHDRAARAEFEAQMAELDAQARKAEETAQHAGAAATATATTPDTAEGLNDSAADEPKVKQEASEADRSSANTLAPITPSFSVASVPPNNGHGNGLSPVLPESQRVFRPPPNPHRGQLLPSHLREAVRRYKRDCEGGGVGFSGLSLGNLSTRGAFTWNIGSAGGRRLFR